MKWSIRLLYLYLFSFIGLLIVVIGSIRLVDLGLKVIVFQGADEYTVSRPIIEKDPTASREATLQEDWEATQKIETARNRKREVSSAIAMIIIGLPLYLYHWRRIQTEK